MTGPQHNLPDATVSLRPPNERLNRILSRVSDSPLRTGNRLELLLNGPATFEDWLSAIRGAERWVHLENYIFRADATGRRFAEALCERAAAGVRVRVLVDWFGCLNVPRSFWRGMRKSGVEVRTVNAPTLRGSLRDLSRRDHRKLLAVDGAYASTGGICIADDWMRRSSETGLPYRDTAVSVRGPAVADLERAFAGVWDDTGSSLPPDERPAAEDIPAAGTEAARVVIQEPRKMRVLRTLQVLCAGVERRLWIADAYFLSVPILTQSLMSAARDGVDVRVLVPATNDLPWIGALSRTGYPQMLQAGVRIFEYGGPMMHAKTTVADGWWSRIGSTNLNVSSLMANWEVDLVAEDYRFGEQMERTFEEDLENAREVRLVSTARRQKAEPERRISRAERRAQRESRGSGSRAAATLTRVGSVALRKGEEPVHTHERALGAAIGSALLAASMLGTRFPRLLSWPLSAIAALAGLSVLLRAMRSPEEEYDEPED
jgi:cardiolipin synthase